MKTLKDFTPEIKAKIPIYIEEALRGVFDGGRYSAFDFVKAKKAIDHTYTYCGYNAPSAILVVENPLELQLVGNMLQNKQLHSKLDSKLDSQLYLQLDSQLYSQLDSQLVSQLVSQLRSKLISQLDSKLDSQLYSQLDSQLRSQSIEYINHYIFTNDVYSDVLLTWFTFISNELVKGTEIADELAVFRTNQIESGVYQGLWFADVAVVCKYPKMIHRNANNDLHCTTGVAVEWGGDTAFDCYYVNGRSVNTEIFTKALRNEFTLADVLALDSEDERAAIIDMYKENNDDEWLAKEFFKATKVDSHMFIHTCGSVETMHLWRTDDVFAPVGEHLVWIEEKCPSTGQVYFINVPPTITTVVDAAKFLRPEEVPLGLDYNHKLFSN